MTQLNNNQAKHINNAVANFFDASVSYDDARTQLEKAMREAKVTREAVRPAVVLYVCKRIHGAIYDEAKGTLVNNRNHTNPNVRKAYETAKRQISRILATAEGKPVKKDNKVDPVDSVYKMFAKLTPAQAKRFLSMVK